MRGRFDVQALDVIQHRVALLFQVELAQVCKVRERGQRDVVAHVHRQHQALVLAVLGGKAEAGPDGVQRAADVHALAGQINLAGILLVHAEDGPRRLRAARAHQSGDAEDLARAHGKGNVLHLLAGVQMLHAQKFIAQGHMDLGEFLLQLAAHHVADDLVDAYIRHVHGGDVLAVAHDGGAVADLLDFFKAVGDVYDGHAAFLEHADDAKQRVDLAVGQRRGRLVHDEYARVEGQGLGHFHHLLVGHAQIADEGMGVDLHAKVVQQLLRLAEHGAPVHLEGVFHDRPAHEDVFRHGQLLGEVQFLIDDGDAQFLRVGGRADVHFLSVDEYLALVLAVSAGEHLHQRRFARAVLAQQGVHFALAHGQAHMVKRQHAGKPLDDVAHFQKFGHGVSSLQARESPALCMRCAATHAAPPHNRGKARAA